MMECREYLEPGLKVWLFSARFAGDTEWTRVTSTTQQCDPFSFTTDFTWGEITHHVEVFVP